MHDSIYFAILISEISLAKFLENNSTIIVTYNVTLILKQRKMFCARFMYLRQINGAPSGNDVTNVCT